MTTVYTTDPEPSWFVDGKCASTPDPDIWFTPARAVTAKAVCAGCPVRGDCLEHAIDRNITDGIWGGYDPAERDQLFPRTRRSRR